MAGWLSECAEVARNADQGPAEIQSPNPVDDHARGQWVVRAGDRLSQFLPAAPLSERLRLSLGEYLQEATADDGSLIADIAADENMQVGRRALANDVHSVFGLARLSAIRPGTLVFQPPVKHARARKHAGKGIVILGRNWVEFMIMTARASHRQAEQPPADRIDALFPFVRHHRRAITAKVLRSQAEEAKGYLVGQVVWLDQVGCQL